MSRPNLIEIVCSPLLPLNGFYVLDDKYPIYVHSTGQFHLHCKNGKWVIKNPTTKEVFAESYNVDVELVQLRWSYYSAKNNIYKVSRDMRLLVPGLPSPSSADVSSPVTPGSTKSTSKASTAKESEVPAAGSASPTKATAKQGTTGSTEAAGSSSKSTPRRRSVPAPPARPDTSTSAEDRETAAAQLASSSASSATEAAAVEPDAETAQADGAEAAAPPAVTEEAQSAVSAEQEGVPGEATVGTTDAAAESTPAVAPATDGGVLADGEEKPDGSDGDLDGFVNVRSPDKTHLDDAAPAQPDSDVSGHGEGAEAGQEQSASSPGPPSEAATTAEAGSAKETPAACSPSNNAAQASGGADGGDADASDAEEGNADRADEDAGDADAGEAFADAFSDASDAEAETFADAAAGEQGMGKESEMHAASEDQQHVAGAPYARPYPPSYEEDLGQPAYEAKAGAGPIPMGSGLDDELAAVNTGNEEDASEEPRESGGGAAEDGDDQLKHHYASTADDTDDTVPASAEPYGFPYTTPPPSTAAGNSLPAAHHAPMPSTPPQHAAPHVARPPSQPSPYTSPSPNKPSTRPPSSPAPAPAPAAAATPAPAPHAAAASPASAAAHTTPAKHAAPEVKPVPVMPPLPKYTRKIPTLYSTASVDDWVEENPGLFDFTSGVVYKNLRNGKVRYELPSYRPNIVSYHLDVGKEKLEVFAPAGCAKELGKQPLLTAYVDQLPPLEAYWTSTVASYEHKISVLQYFVNNFRADAAQGFAEKEAGLNARLQSLEAELKTTKEKEKLAEQRANNLMSRVGKSHIKRDWQQSKVASGFPAGEDVRDEFQKAFLNFESFACDAVNCFEDLKIEDPASALVHQVMSPIYSETRAYVESRLKAKKDRLEKEFGTIVPSEDVATDESVPRLFWYQTQQAQFPAEIAALTEEDIMGMTDHMHEWVTDLYNRMIDAAEEGLIDSGEQNLRVPHIVRHFLRLHTVTMLSDPCCYLHPAPGASTCYREGHCVEILSPGTKKYGRIKEGDVVEVVLSGLYFENPHGGDPKPVMPSMVRRLVTASV